jgi:hypothetical protein
MSILPKSPAQMDDLTRSGVVAEGDYLSLPRTATTSCYGVDMAWEPRRRLFDSAENFHTAPQRADSGRFLRSNTRGGWRCSRVTA